MNGHKCDCKCNSQSNLFEKDTFSLLIICNCKTSNHSRGCSDNEKPSSGDNQIAISNGIEDNKLIL